MTRSDSDSVGLVLLCRGVLGADAKAELRQLRERVQININRQQLQTEVHIAYIDRLAPSLPEALDLCRNHGKVVILPMLVPDEPSLRRWLNKVVMRWRQSQADVQQIVVGASLVANPNIERLLLDAFIQLNEQGSDIQAEVDDWERDPLAWSTVPEHQQVLLWCTGPRCAAKGALTLWPKLTQAVQKMPEVRKQVLLMQTTCQYPCNHAPLLSVQPDGVWYGNLTEERLTKVLQCQLVEKRPLAEAIVHTQKSVDAE